jgi:hypothetical protein
VQWLANRPTQRPSDARRRGAEEGDTGAARPARTAAREPAMTRTNLRKQKGNFKKSPVQLASLLTPEDLKFERADWTIFRTIQGLQQKAGVSQQYLRRLTLKELTHNAFDASDKLLRGTKVRVGELRTRAAYFIQDEGRGIERPRQTRSLSYSASRDHCAPPPPCGTRADLPSNISNAERIDD